jgi:predicted transcriptional regulator
MFLRGIAEASYQNVLMQRSLEGTRVEQAMTRDVVSVPPELPVSALMSEYFLRYGYRNFPVRGNGTAEGWISLADVKEITPEQRERKTVSEAMVRLDEKMIVSPQTPVSHAFRKMTEQNMSRLIVVGPQNEMLGLITKTGVLRYLEIQNTLSAS